MKPWTREEDELLCLHYQAKGSRETAELLDGRTRQAVLLRAHRLGVKGRMWVPAEDRVIRVCYRSYGAEYCRRYMPHRTVVAITCRARVLGVQRDNRLKREHQIRKAEDPSHDHADHGVEVHRMATSGKWGLK